MFSVFSHEYYMKQALKEAQKAALLDEIPVGAVIICNQKIIARAHNWTEHLTDVTAHAEILAITAASKHLGNKYLQQCSLYVTLEPCVMCFGAMIHARIERIVFGAPDPKTGVCGSCMNLNEESFFNHKISITGGVLKNESSELLRLFFKSKRDIQNLTS